MAETPSPSNNPNYPSVMLCFDTPTPMPIFLESLQEQSYFHSSWPYHTHTRWSPTLSARFRLSSATFIGTSVLSDETAIQLLPSNMVRHGNNITRWWGWQCTTLATHYIASISILSSNPPLPPSPLEWNPRQSQESKCHSVPSNKHTAANLYVRLWWSF